MSLRSDAKNNCLNTWLLLWLILRSDVPIAWWKQTKFCTVLAHFRGNGYRVRNAFLSNAVERKCKGYGFLFQKDVLDLEADSCIVPGEALQWKSPCVRCLSVWQSGEVSLRWKYTHACWCWDALTSDGDKFCAYPVLMVIKDVWKMVNITPAPTAHRKAFCCRYIAFCLEKASWVWCCWRGIICFWVMFLPKHSGCQHSC